MLMRGQDMNLKFIGSMFSQNKAVPCWKSFEAFGHFPNKILMNTLKSFLELSNPLHQTAKLRLFHGTLVPLENMGGYLLLSRKIK